MAVPGLRGGGSRDDGKWKGLRVAQGRKIQDLVVHMVLVQWHEGDTAGKPRDSLARGEERILS